VRDGSGADVAAGGWWLSGNDRVLRVNLRAVFRISVGAGACPLRGHTRPPVPVMSRARAGPRPGHGRPGCGYSRELAWCYMAGGIRPRGTRAGGTGWKGAFGLMRWRHRFLLVLSRGRPRAEDRARPDLTARGEPSVDAAGPGRQASKTCPPTRYPATAEATGRSTPTTTARDLRWPPGHPPSAVPYRPARWSRRAGRAVFALAGRPDGYPAGGPAVQACRGTCRPRRGRARRSAAKYT
jgi:hypothetical protein